MNSEKYNLAECGVDAVLSGIASAAIAGHVSPDGDCVGSTCALWAYIRKNYPDIRVDLYLEPVKQCFLSMPGIENMKTKAEDGASYDALFLLDVSAGDRIGAAEDLYTRCKQTVCIDHHRTNKGICDINHIVADASSTCEVLYDILDHDRIDEEIASCLYLGIIHDTGLLTYTNTSVHTLKIVEELFSYGIPHTGIASETYLSRTFTQTKILGYVLERAELALGGECIVSSVTPEAMKRYGAKKSDTDEIVSQLKNTVGVSSALFLYPEGEGYKASLRSAPHIDVSRVAAAFGGGGHRQASGCTLSMGLEEAKAAVLAELAGEYERNSESL